MTIARDVEKFINFFYTLLLTYSISDARHDTETLQTRTAHWHIACSTSLTRPPCIHVKEAAMCVCLLVHSSLLCYLLSLLTITLSHRSCLTPQLVSLEFATMFRVGINGTTNGGSHVMVTVSFSTSSLGVARMWGTFWVAVQFLMVWGLPAHNCVWGIAAWVTCIEAPHCRGQ